MGEYLKSDGFIEHLAGKFNIESILQFLEDNEITVDKFGYVGKCDGDCSDCGNDKFSLWREEVLYDKNSEKFYMVDDEEIEFVRNSLDEFDFAIYICDKCNQWTTFID